MNYANLNKWLRDRNITLEDGFTSALEGYVEEYKKK